MIQLLLRIEDLSAELPFAILIAAGVITLLIGFFIWLGGARYIGFLTALIGATVGAFLGLALSNWLNIPPGIAFVSSAILCVLAYFLRNIVILALAILIFAAVSGTGYLGYVLNSSNWSYTPYSTSEIVMPEPDKTPESYEDRLLDGLLIDKGSAQDEIDTPGNTLYATESPDTTHRIKSMMSDIWSSTSSHHGKLFIIIIAGGLAGLLLVWLIKIVIMSLCCSIVGATFTIAGVQMLLLAKNVSMIKPFEERPNILFIIAVGMVIFGWFIQVFIIKPVKPIDDQTKERKKD